ncbi:Rabenosyn-5 [Desmophyllum pertusum]|uniref:Rabenosyn-5 n=1 Tax=Desmophyllum pertusum TaxID=174260 RepID=A0A9X0CQP9_9CNID|nr:Rabenosyn-5 [Desmophyllum pertusum]
MEDDEIKEGFICPMCMKDLGNALVLQKHFEESHSEDKDTLHRMRGMFGKAKRKIMDKIESSEGDGAIVENVDSALEGPVSRGVDPFLWDHQEFGASRSRFREFRDRRDAEIDRFVVETNKILIRLEKLLRSGVHVLDSPALPARPGRKFSVLKLDQPGSHGLPRRTKARSKDDSDEAGIRACQACMDCLERYDKQEKEKKTKPAVVQLYEKMKSCMAEAESLQPVYTKMADSINLGDIQYDLEEAAHVRAKLLKMYESVDIIR